MILKLTKKQQFIFAVWRLWFTLERATKLYLPLPLQRLDFYQTKRDENRPRQCDTGLVSLVVWRQQEQIGFLVVRGSPPQSMSSAQTCRLLV